MTEKRQRTEVVSLRLSADELARIQVAAGNDGSVSGFIRERSLDAATPSYGSEWGLARWRGRSWRVDAAPARSIGVGAAHWTDGLFTIVDPSDARALAAALLTAADIAEQPNPADEAWDRAHAEATA